ncbi:MAG: hypothetical protein C0501_14085 [Isosphaera sp.]|nr:hypothetical protein [Isosphaera sp.]
MMTADDALRVGRSGSAADELVAALGAALRQVHDLIAGMSDEQYTRRPGGALASSIGGHVRHNLDHVAALLAGLPGGAVDYDRRERGTAVESDRQAGLAAVRRLELALGRVAWCELPGAVRLAVLPAADRTPVELLTTPERELAFVVSHTTHHNALIAVIAAAVGAAVPPGFGYAPATIAHQRGQPCAR